MVFDVKAHKPLELLPAEVGRAAHRATNLINGEIPPIVDPI